MFYGAPTDRSVAAALQEAALEVASDVCQRQGTHAACGTDQARSSLQELLTVLMWGLAGLTAAQLQAASSEVLCLAGASVNNAAVDQLCQQLRYGHSTVCRCAISHVKYRSCPT